jgi:hypothetical protein
MLVGDFAARVLLGTGDVKGGGGERGAVNKQQYPCFVTDPHSQLPAPSKTVSHHPQALWWQM